jgi:radical SAM protein with 4Fe4S-binding SPASM domain
MRSFKYGPLKMHLRKDPDGRGVLVINASSVLHLDHVATRFFEAFTEVWAGTGDLAVPDMPAEVARKVARAIARRYRVTAARALADWELLWGRVMAVARGDACPFSDVGVARVDPFSIEAAAPYRVDLALTYRCDNDCPHCYAGGPHETPELDTAAWRTVLDRLADFEVPNVVFTGGEATLREDLPELIAHAEENGLVTGLITNGRGLTPERVRRLEAAGLDYVQVTLESCDEAAHDAMCRRRGAWRETVAGLRNCAGRVFTTTNTTLTTANEATAIATVRFLKELGVARFGVNAVIMAGRGREERAGALSVERVKALVEEIEAVAHQLSFPFLWFTPTCYKVLNPVALGLGVKSCSAASTVLAVEPDGTVMPCQSFFVPLGNALADDFRAMWGSDLAVSLRRRKRLAEKCRDCAELGVCGGGCPLEQGLYEGAGSPRACR